MIPLLMMAWGLLDHPGVHQAHLNQARSRSGGRPAEVTSQLFEAKTPACPSATKFCPSKPTGVVIGALKEAAPEIYCNLHVYTITGSYKLIVGTL